MSISHNKISNKQLKSIMLTENQQRITLSFYKYFSINDLYKFRNKLYHNLIALQVFGRIYIANEGINAQISVPQNKFNLMRDLIYSTHPKLNKLRLNIALDNKKLAFWVLRIKIRPTIVADGIKDPNFNLEKVGYYLKAEEVNNMVNDPNVLLVDIRNYYEYEIGHFKNAIPIYLNTFREQLLLIVKYLSSYKEKKIVIYCTGGIRCEKASAWLIYNGFKNVYHIEGGIIGYVNSAINQGLPIKFIGKNFVFDSRLSEQVTSDVIARCYQCGTLYDNHSNCNNKLCHVLFIQCVKCSIKYNNCCSISCKEYVNYITNN